MKLYNNNTDIAFSIIIPIYNAETTLERTIESILSQTFTNYELLLIDDCSTDKSFEIAQRYEGIYQYVHAFRLSHNSGSAKMPCEKGATIARGKFLLIIGNDDIINDTYLSSMWNVISQSPEIDVVIPLTLIIESTTGVLESQLPDTKVDMTIAINGKTACEMVMPTWSFSCNGMAFRRELYDFVRSENPYTYMNSDEYSSRIILYHARNVAFSKGSEYTYFQYSFSITHKRSVKLFETLYTDYHLISFAERYFNSAVVTAMCTKMLSNLICLYKSFLSEKSYTMAERDKIIQIFKETYPLLQSRKKYFHTIKSKLLLVNWCVFAIAIGTIHKSKQLGTILKTDA